MDTVFLILPWMLPSLTTPPPPQLAWLLGQTGHDWSHGWNQVGIRWLLDLHRAAGLKYHVLQNHVRPGGSAYSSPIWAELISEVTNKAPVCPLRSSECLALREGISLQGSSFESFGRTIPFSKLIRWLGINHELPAQGVPEGEESMVH